MRIPTHVVGVARERRIAPRAKLCLPVRLMRVDGQPNPEERALQTVNISSTGVCLVAPVRIEPGTDIQVEVALLQRPAGRGSVRMRAVARIVRVAPATDGLHSLAATFDDIVFDRDEPLPPRFQTSV